MSEIKPILPGTPEFDAAIKQAEQVTNGNSLQIQFEKLQLNDTTYLEHTVVQLSDQHSKIVLLLCRAGMTEMTVVSQKLQGLTQELNIPGTHAECEVRPIRAKQLDYVLFDVPNARVSTIRNYFIRQIQELFAK